MKPIGGFFELEFCKGEHYHKKALRLNSARNCFEYILRARGYEKVYIPYYTCEAILQPLKKLQVEYEFYSIDKHFELSKEIILQSNEALLYTNYYALKQTYTNKLARIYGSQLIVDNSQAFFAPHLDGIDTFYSPRKFFGVADGGYLYTDVFLNLNIQQDTSFDRMEHLLKRIDVDSMSAYEIFRKNEDALDFRPMRLMSRLTEHIMCSIDYERMKLARLHNYNFLQIHLGDTNKLNFDLSADAVPMVYPYLTDDATLKQRLIQDKIFVATYWPNVMEWCSNDDLEYKLATRIIPLPIDHRYGLKDMRRIIDAILG